LLFSKVTLKLIEAQLNKERELHNINLHLIKPGRKNFR